MEQLLKDKSIDTIGNCANCGVEFHIHKEMEKDLKRVYVTQDDDEQYYILPYGLQEDFKKELNENYLLESEFERKFSKYRVGVDISNIELYARI